MPQPIRVFISYAREDFHRVEPLWENLVQEGFEPWMDKKNVLPGEKWEQSVWKAVRRADFFLVCLSNRAINKRGFLQKEIKRALTIWQEKLENDIYLIPIRLEDCEVPEGLSEFQWVDFFEPAGFDNLVKAPYEGSERIRKSQNVQQTSGTGLSIRTETLRDSRQEIPQFDVDVEYPQIVGASDNSVEEVNTILRATILREVHECRSVIFSDNLGEPEAPMIPSASLDGRYNVELFAKAFISVSYSLSTYNYPAAYPNSRPKVCNLCLNPVASITLADIFNWDSVYLETLAEYCDKDLKKQSAQQYPELPSVGLDSFIPFLKEEGPGEEKFSLFTIREGALNFIFIGPRVLGIWQVSVPFTVLQHHFSERSLIRQLFG